MELLETGKLKAIYTYINNLKSALMHI